LEKGLLGFALGSVLLALLFSLDVGIDYDAVSNRYSIFGDNANNIGIRMSISLIIIPVAIIQNAPGLGKLRYMLLLGIPLIFNTMIATGSRVSFLAFFFSYIAFLVLFKSENKLVKPIVSLVGMIILVYILTVVLKSEEIIHRLILSFREGDLSERDMVWKSIMPIWISNPLFGVGKTGYEYITLNTIGRVISPHNVLLEVLCLTGITGLVLYLSFLYRITRMSYLTFTYNRQLMPLLLLIPIFGLLLSAQLLQVKIGWAVFSYIIASSIAVSSPVMNKNTITT
jgi:O-antigen ligase